MMAMQTDGLKQEAKRKEELNAIPFLGPGHPG